MAIKDPATKKLYDRLYQKVNRARLNARRRARYASEPEYRQQKIDHARAYRATHKAECAEYGRKKYAAKKAKLAKLAAAAVENGHE